MARGVRSGMLWTQGAEFVHAKAVGRGQLGMCWKRFYQYERFSWLPNEIIPGWRPSCPNEDCHCDTNNDKLSVQSRTTPRRCVYGLIKNCILDSPVQWICKSCQLKSLNEEAIGVPKKDLSKYRPAYFKGVEEQTSWCFCALSMLSHSQKYNRQKDRRSPTSFCNEKGMGPTCVAELIKCWHWEHKGECELQWIHYVLRWIQQPLPGEIINKSSITRFPDYDSEEICGRTPSQSYLTDVFCMINLDKKYLYDSHIASAQITNRCD